MFRWHITLIGCAMMLCGIATTVGATEPLFKSVTGVAPMHARVKVEGDKTLTVEEFDVIKSVPEARARVKIVVVGGKEVPITETYIVPVPVMTTISNDRYVPLSLDNVKFYDHEWDEIAGKEATKKLGGKGLRVVLLETWQNKKGKQYGPKFDTSLIKEGTLIVVVPTPEDKDPLGEPPTVGDKPEGKK